jgi:GNAT superfamily N-acetyltransferase
VSLRLPFSIRDATLADVPALARLHVETFTETHRRGFPGGPTYELRESQWHQAFENLDDSWFCLVVEDSEGRLVGFAKGTRHDGGIPGFTGELNKIYLLRRVQRQGLGTRLLGAVTTRFLAQGVTSMLLFGDAALPANHFYEAFGAERLVGPSGEFHGACGWRDLRALAARCAQ